MLDFKSHQHCEGHIATFAAFSGGGRPYWLTVPSVDHLRHGRAPDWNHWTSYVTSSHERIPVKIGGASDSKSTTLTRQPWIQ